MRGRAMDRKGRSKGDGRFVQLLDMMLESEAVAAPYLRPHAPSTLRLLRRTTVRTMAVLH